jgi:hypothetical protein
MAWLASRPYLYAQNRDLGEKTNMDRRQFLLSAAAYALPIPPGNGIGFDVLRNGAPIGQHHLSFSQSGDALNVNIDVELLVKFAGITLFRYSLHGVERWQSGTFQSLDTSVNFNGDALQVHAEKTAAGYSVTGINHDNPAKNMPEYTAPPDTLPLTYWNKAMLKGTILNVQTAHCYKVHVADAGWFSVPTENGAPITAQRYDLTGKLQLSVWYDDKNAWSGLEFQKSGDIAYRKITS